MSQLLSKPQTAHHRIWASLHLGSVSLDRTRMGHYTFQQQQNTIVISGIHLCDKIKMNMKPILNDLISIESLTLSLCNCAKVMFLSPHKNINTQYYSSLHEALLLSLCWLMLVVVTQRYMPCFSGIKIPQYLDFVKSRAVGHWSTVFGLCMCLYGTLWRGYVCVLASAMYVRGILVPGHADLEKIQLSLDILLGLASEPHPTTCPLPS